MRDGEPGQESAKKAAGPVVIGAEALDIADVLAVARAGAKVALAPQARRAIAAARAVVERHEREGRAVYGLTRGLGSRVVEEVAPEDRTGYSRVVLLARACAAGPPFPAEVVRAALLVRAAGLARAGAGVRPRLVEALIAQLNAGLHPYVPSVGSVGAADIALMANLALPLIGEGRAEIEGELLGGAEAMARAGLEPLTLESKEGLALCSSNGISTGQGALVFHDTVALLELMDGVVALTFEAFRANLSPLDPRVVAARPAPGQAAAAASLRDKLSGSDLLTPGAARRLQDPISLRCVSQVHGALRAGLAFLRPALEAELNGAGDNPLVLAEDDEVLSTGNFHTPALAIAFDSLALALSQCASLAAARVARLLDGDFTGLPDRLSTKGATRIGPALLSLTAATLTKEIRRLALPACLDDSSGYPVEDHAPMTPAAVRKAAEILGHLRQVVACELIVAAQALDLRRPAQVAPVAQALRDALRAKVPALDDDRSQTEDLEKATALIASGTLAEAMASAARDS